MSTGKILLVEDDPSLGYVILDNLTLKGYSVMWCHDGNEGLRIFTESVFDICLLDIMLPKKDGFTLAKDIRSVNKSVPILFLTAKSLLEDKLEGFQSGADDYICKPFSIEELVCRLEVFLKRSSISEEHSLQDIYTLGAFEFNFKNLTLKHSDGNKTLTSKEAEILKLFCCNTGRILKREDILKHIWGDDDYFMGRSMDVFISRLRKYLKYDTRIQIINYHSVGFRLEIARESSTS